MASRSKLMKYIDYRMRVTISATRSLVGTFMAFDRHMNLVLADCEEYRVIKNKQEEKTLKRSLGLVVLRGQSVISITVSAPPPPKPRAPTAKALGVAKPIQQTGTAPRGLIGSIAGVGGPGMQAMAPNIPRGMAPPAPPSSF